MASNQQALVTKLAACKRLEIKRACPKGLGSPAVSPANVEGSDP